MIFKSESLHYIQYYRQMLPTNRLKLGPKRKDGNAFQRLHKLHSHHQSQNFHQGKGYPMTNVEEIPQTFNNSQVQINPSLNQVIHNQPSLSHTKFNASINYGLKVAQNGVLTERNNQKQYSQRDELQQRCINLQTQLIEQQKQNQAYRFKNDEFQIKQKSLMTQCRELDQNMRVLTTQHQQLQQEHKKLLVQINNFDKNYYQQEITRLRSTCEELQIANVQYNYKLQKSQQNSRETEIQIKKKQDEIKTLQKFIEKDKIGLAQSKAQSNSKDMCFRLALQESEAANQVLCRSVEDMTRQLQREQKTRKDKQSIIQGLQVQIEALLGRGRDMQAKYLQLRKSNEQQMNEMAKRLMFLQKQEEAKNRESQITISRLSADVNALKTQQVQSLATSRLENQNRQSELIAQREIKIVRLQQEMRQLREKYQGSEKVVASLQAKLKDYYSPEQYTALERRCKELEEKRLSSARYYEEKLYNYQKENDKLRLEKSIKVPEEAKQNLCFDQVVKKTIEESQCLRDELKRMSQVLGGVKEEAAEVRQKEKGYLNQLEILRKKQESTRKNFEIELQVERQKLLNQIQSLKRKLSTVQTRLQYKISETRQKDDFIKNFLISRSEPQQRQSVLRQLQRIFCQRSCQQSE